VHNAHIRDLDKIGQREQSFSCQMIKRLMAFHQPGGWFGAGLGASFTKTAPYYLSGVYCILCCQTRKLPLENKR